VRTAHEIDPEMGVRVAPPLYNTGMMRETEMTNTNTLPSWDEIFTNLALEIASYDATLARLNELNQ
jgi:hypothetical protein